MNIDTVKVIISDFLTVLKFVDKKNKLKYFFFTNTHIF